MMLYCSMGYILSSSDGEEKRHENCLGKYVAILCQNIYIRLLWKGSLVAWIGFQNQHASALIRMLSVSFMKTAALCPRGNLIKDGSGER